MPPVCFGSTAGHPHGSVALQRKYYKNFEQKHKCKILSFNMYGLKYILKYKTQLKINITTLFNMHGLPQYL
jgi:hypothetical protein